MSADCNNREGTYVPWTFGELFVCTECGRRVRQSHTVRPLGLDMGDYDSVYPIPSHMVDGL